MAKATPFSSNLLLELFYNSRAGRHRARLIRMFSVHVSKLNSPIMGMMT